MQWTISRSRGHRSETRKPENQRTSRRGPGGRSKPEPAPSRRGVYVSREVGLPMAAPSRASWENSASFIWRLNKNAGFWARAIKSCEMRVEQERSEAPTCTPMFKNKFGARVKVGAPNHGAGGSLLLHSHLLSFESKASKLQGGVPCDPVLGTSVKAAVLPPPHPGSPRGDWTQMDPGVCSYQGYNSNPSPKLFPHRPDYMAAQIPVGFMVGSRSQDSGAGWPSGYWVLLRPGGFGATGWWPHPSPSPGFQSAVSGAGSQSEASTWGEGAAC